MTHYVITADGTVRSYKRAQVAAAMCSQIFASGDKSVVTAEGDNLSTVPSALLVILHNIIRPEKPVKKFADRETAEKRMKGVLEVLAKPGEMPTLAVPSEENASESTPEVSTSSEDTNVATKTKKAPAAKKAGTKRVAAAEITDATVRKCVKARFDGKGWPEICKDLGEKFPAFVLRVRPLMKKVDRNSVAKLGPAYSKSK